MAPETKTLRLPSTTKARWSYVTLAEKVVVTTTPSNETRTKRNSLPAMLLLPLLQPCCLKRKMKKNKRVLEGRRRESRRAGSIYKAENAAFVLSTVSVSPDFGSSSLISPSELVEYIEIIYKNLQARSSFLCPWLHGSRVSPTASELFPTGTSRPLSVFQIPQIPRTNRSIF